MSGSDSNNRLSSPTACKTSGHAISLASSGDSLVVTPATYTERLGIAISLNIIGSVARTTIIDGQAAGSVIVISSPAQVTLSNITVRNGHALFGAGIQNEGRLTINSSTVTGTNASVASVRNFWRESLADGRLRALCGQVISRAAA